MQKLNISATVLQVATIITTLLQRRKRRLLEAGQGGLAGATRAVRGAVGK